MQRCDFPSHSPRHQVLGKVHDCVKVCANVHGQLPQGSADVHRAHHLPQGRRAISWQALQHTFTGGEQQQRVVRLQCRRFCCCTHTPSLRCWREAQRGPLVQAKAQCAATGHSVVNAHQLLSQQGRAQPRLQQGICAQVHCTWPTRAVWCRVQQGRRLCPLVPRSQQRGSLLGDVPLPHFLGVQRQADALQTRLQPGFEQLGRPRFVGGLTTHGVVHDACRVQHEHDMEHEQAVSRGHGCGARKSAVPHNPRQRSCLRLLPFLPAGWRHRLVRGALGRRRCGRTRCLRRGRRHAHREA